MEYLIEDLSCAESASAAVERIEDGLEAFNVSHRRDDGAGPLILAVHDDGGEVVAGLKGRTAYGWLRIDILWVDEVHRGHGLGRKLLQAAESIAADRGCHAAHLDTHGFQAPDFYRANGYEVFGVLDDYPVGGQHFYLKKRLLRRGEGGGGETGGGRDGLSLATIRPQYHLRRTGDGIDAWDVRRLIDLSRDLPVYHVDPGQFRELDENHWYFQVGAEPTARSILEHVELMLACDLRHPIILDASGRIMDGMHRVCRAILDGVDRIPAVRFEADPAPDFVNCDPAELPYSSSSGPQENS